MLNEISKRVYEANKLKGFDVKNENLSQTLLLIVSEITEAQDALRKNRAPKNWNEHSAAEIWHYGNDDEFKKLFEEHIKDTFEDEIADTFIRLFDLCGAFNIDIDKHIALKIRFNALREHKHGKAF